MREEYREREREREKKRINHAHDDTLGIKADNCMLIIKSCVEILLYTSWSADGKTECIARNIQLTREKQLFFVWQGIVEATASTVLKSRKRFFLSQHLLHTLHSCLKDNQIGCI